MEKRFAERGKKWGEKVWGERKELGRGGEIEQRQTGVGKGKVWGDGRRFREINWVRERNEESGKMGEEVDGSLGSRKGFWAGGRDFEEEVERILKSRKGF